MHTKTALATLFSTLLFGTNFVFTRLVMPPLDAFSFLFVRSAIGVGFLAVVVSARHEWARYKILFLEHRKQLVVLGLVLYFGCNLGVYMAVRLTDTSHIIILQQFSVFVVFLVNMALYHRIPSRLIVVAGILNVLGAFLVLFPIDLGANPLLIGDLLVIASVLVGVAFNFKNNSMSKRLPPDLIAIVVSLFMMAGTLPAMLVLAVISTNPLLAFAMLSPQQWCIVAWLGIGISGLAYWLNSVLNSDPHIMPEHAAILSNLTAVVGIVLAVSLLGDLLAWWDIAGAALIIISAYMAQAGHHGMPDKSAKALKLPNSLGRDNHEND